MKVRTINPGGVYRSPTDPTRWTYFIMYDNTKISTYDTFLSANEAKQAMREKVYHERRRHACEKTCKACATPLFSDICWECGFDQGIP